jgi:DNA-nicking Smr family endonuclease
MGKHKTPEHDAENLFRAQMADVTPLPAEPRIEHRPRKPAPRPRPAPAATADAGGFVAREQLAPLGPDESQFFTRAGLQQRAQRRLKRGELAIEARLDLHGHTLERAAAELAHFLQAAQAHGCRCVLVIHGKGQRSAQGKPVLKSQVDHWLRQHPAVMGFASAQPRHGGAGALYVLLRRGPEERP